MSFFEEYGAFKMLGGIANSVDPDQTAPSGAVWSWSALFACAILSNLDVQSFRTFTIQKIHSEHVYFTTCWYVWESWKNSSVDANQMLQNVWSASTLFAQAYLSQYFGLLW